MINLGINIMENPVLVGALVGSLVSTCVIILLNTIGHREKSSHKLAFLQKAEELWVEIEKLRNHNREAERRIDDLTRKLQQADARYKSKEVIVDDLEDDLTEAEAKIKKLTQQNDDLMHKVQELRMVCDNYEMEIAELKMSREYNNEN